MAVDWMEVTVLRRSMVGDDKLLMMRSCCEVGNEDDVS